MALLISGRLDVMEDRDIIVAKFVDKMIMNEPLVTEVGNDLFNLADVHKYLKIVVDMGNVEYLSSPAMGKIITLNKKMEALGGKLVLCNIQPKVLKVMRQTGLAEFFDLAVDELAARQTLY